MGLVVQNFLTGCGVDCDDVVLLPPIPEVQDCTTYTQTLSQVSDLFLIPDDASDIFASWSTTPTLVSGGIDNTNADNTKAKWLVGMGGVAAPEKIVSEYPKLKTRVTERVYTLILNVKQLDATTYEMCRRLQCGWTGFTFYYADLGDWVYGVAGGISPESADCDFPKGAGNTDKNEAVITITWRSDGDPERRVNPHS